MKVQGIIRQLDDLGRVVIPKEYRRQLDIKEGQDLEILIVNDFIIIGKAKTEDKGAESNG